MALATADDLSEPFTWPAAGVTRIPYRLFTDPEIYALEQQRIFRGPVWHFLCLDIDIPEAGDFKTTTVGEIPVVVTRDEQGAVHAMVNRCAHKGALVCLKERGNARMLHCVYHSWSYDLAGRLRGLAFRHGIDGKGGMPEGFDPAQLRLEPLRVTAFCGLIFGTFSDATPPIESYLGAAMTPMIERNLRGRRFKRLGLHSQLIHNNWKLYAENVRDSYHATLLHTFYTTFKINRLDMDGGIILADDKWHSISYAKRHTLDEAAEYKTAEVHSARYENALHAPQLLDSWEEYDDGISHVIQTIFPTLAIHYTLNSLAVRFFTPRGLDKTELFWLYLGDAEDDDGKTAIRTMQGNLTGAAGLVSLEDGCINEFVQRGVRGSAGAEAVSEMGGHQVESGAGARATEAAIRGFWTGYRHVMGFA